MRRLTLLFFLSFVVNFTYSQSTRLIPYRSGDQWGYCDESKKIVIRPHFKSAGLFYGDHAVAEDESGKFIIDRKGNRVSDTYKIVHFNEDGKHYGGCQNYDQCIYFDVSGKAITGTVQNLDAFNDDGLAVLRVGYGKAGVIDRQGNVIIPAQFRNVELFAGKLAVVYDGKNFGLHNLEKGIVVPCVYSRLYDPQEGMLFAKKGDQFGFIDITGKEVVPFKYQQVPWASYFGEQNFFDFNYHNFSEGLAVVVENGKCGYVDKQGKVAIPFQYETAYGFSKGLAWVKQKGKWGMINKSGKLVIPCEYDEYNNLSAKELEALVGVSDGMVRLKKNGKVGFADSLGRMVIAPRFEDASSFHNGLAAVSENGLWGFINKKGEKVIECKYKMVPYMDDYYSAMFEKGYCFVMTTDTTSVLIDKSGKMLSQLVFTGVVDFINGYAIGQSGDKYYVIDETGKTIMQVASDYSVYIQDKDLAMDYDANCYVNLKTGMRYVD